MRIKINEFKKEKYLRVHFQTYSLRQFLKYLTGTLPKEERNSHTYDPQLNNKNE